MVVTGATAGPAWLGLLAPLARMGRPGLQVLPAQPDRPVLKAPKGHPAQAAGQSVSPGVAALAVAGFAPTLARTDNHAALPGTAALALTGYAPSVAQPLVVVPSAVSLGVLGYAPTISQAAAGAAADPAAVWAYVLPNGKTAAQTLVELHAAAVGGPSATDIAAAVREALADELLQVTDVACLHGLVSGEPLVVTPSSRAAGPVTQTITTAGEKVTVTRAP